MTNLLVNPGFESDGANWSLIAGSPTFPTDQGTKSGLKALLVNNATFIFSQTVVETVVKGARFYIGAWVKLKSGSDASIILTGSTDGDGLLFMVFRSDNTTKFYDADFKEVASRESLPDETGFALIQGSFVADTDAAIIVFGMIQPVGVVPVQTTEFLNTAEWLVDDCFYSRDPLRLPLVYPENGPGPQEFQRSMVDPVSGRLIKEGRVAKDLEGRNRDRSEIDDLSPDDKREHYLPRSEYEPQEP